MRKEMAKQAIHDHRVTVRLTYQAFKISETCYRYDPKLSSENELIADWLLRLTTTHKQWGFTPQGGVLNRVYCALCIYVTLKALNGITSVCIAFTNN